MTYAGNRCVTVPFVAKTSTSITVGFETEIICPRCGMSQRPDVVLELEKVIVPFIASVERHLAGFKEELLSATSDLHDYVGKLNDALGAIQTELSNLVAAQANAVDPADLSALRDAVERASTISTQAVSTSQAVQATDGAAAATPATPATPDASPTDSGVTPTSVDGVPSGSSDSGSSSNKPSSGSPTA